MHPKLRANDFALMYMSGLGARVVAASGRPSDTHHLGELILRALREAPDHILQIDGSTGVSETCASVLERSVRCAVSMRGAGLARGDVIVLMAPNHLDLAIPLYAAMYLGVTVAAVDRTATTAELKGVFEVDEPRMIFCQSEKAPDVQLVVNELNVDAQIVSFDAGDYLCSFAQFVDRHGDDTPVEQFQATVFDPEETIAFLISTSGTTGLPKAAAASHKNFAIAGPYWQSRAFNFPTPTAISLVCSPLQWLTAINHYLFSPIFRYTRLQSTLPLTKDHAYDLINTYKPTQAILSPTLMTALVRAAGRDACDFTCLHTVMLGGSDTPIELIDEIKSVSPDTDVCNLYGMSELTGIGFQPDNSPPGSCGRPLGCFQYRLVNIDTMEDVTEAFQQGELWIKGPGVIKEYYRNAEATAEAFAEGGWFRTGDIFYRDHHWYFYFVERYKLLLKYMSHHISPVELEGVIRQLGGVADVAVTGVADTECGELPVACVVRRAGQGEGGAALTADDVKRVVAETLSEAKQLRGGVIFVEAIPMTATTKVHRRRLKEMALIMERE